MLLILDNFEHLLAQAGIVSELLAAAPDLQIVATSRERLNIREEQIYPIKGLEYPDWEAPENPYEYTAMELFLHSARRVLPDFELEPEDMVYLTRICQLVGGMPLGLELAASWVDMLSVREIAAEIQRSLDFLESNLRNIPDRHRSIRAVFDSSWKCLSTQEQSTFARLSIFRGSFTRGAAEATAEASLRTLSVLASKSLVGYDRESNRYQVHELLRQYGAEQLARSPADEADTSRRLSAFYCGEVSKFMHLFMSGCTQEAVDGLDLDAANIRAAWDWAVAHAHVEYINLALDGLCIYYDWGWRANEALEICTSLHARLTGSTFAHGEDGLQAEHLFAKVLCWEGYFSIYLNLNQSGTLLEESLAKVDHLIEQGLDARDEKCQIRLFQGLGQFLAGDMKKSKVLFEESLAIAKEIDLKWMILRSLSMLGDVARSSGAPGEAKLWYSHSLSTARAQANTWGEITALNDLGWAARSLIAYQEALGYYEEGMKIARSSDHHIEFAHVLESSGYLMLFLGQFEEARQRFAESVQISNDRGLPYRTLPSRVHIGIVSWLTGNFDEAETIIRETVAISQDLDVSARLFPTICLAEILCIQGRYAEARAQLRLLKDVIGELFIDRFTEGRLLRVAGYIALGERKYPEAHEHFQKSIDIFQIITDDEQIAWSQAGLAAAAIHMGKLDEAQRVLIDALWTCIEIQGFIALLFTLPVVSLFLERIKSDRSREFSTEIGLSPFVANAAVFRDVVYRHLPDGLQSLPGEEPPASAEIIRQRLWAAASTVLSSWMQVWMEKNEYLEDEVSES